MQTNASPGSAAYDFQTWTVIVLILLAIMAVIVIAGIIWGSRQARERHRVEEAAEDRAEETGTDLPAAPDQPASGDGGALPAPEPAPQTDPQPVPEPPAPEPEPLPSPAPAPAPAPAAAPEPAPPPAQPTPVAEPTPTPEPAPTPAPVAAVEPAIAGALSLTTIKGLGPKVAAMLAERGITRVDQIAALSAAEATALDAELGAFTGRMVRDRWIDQAKLLSSGDKAAYEAEFGKLG